MSRNTVEPEARTHAKLSPSASKRWMNCADSINVNADTGATNFYAEEGTAAHELLDTVLRLDTDPNRFLGLPIYKHYEVTEDMAAAVGQAVDFVNSYTARFPKAKVHLDTEVDPYALLKCAPGYASGTLDISIDNFPTELVVIDYKHGAGVFVDVLDNTQILQYLLGFFAQYATRPYEKYVMVIIQPRNAGNEGPVRQHTITHEELMAYADSLKKRIKEIKRDPNQRAAGSWCTFCKAAGTCRALANHNMETAALEFSDMSKQPKAANELTWEEIEYVILNAKVILKWLAAVQAHALTMLLRGRKSKQLKLVRGRSSRFWSDDPKVIAILKKMKIDEDEFSPRSLLGVQKITHIFQRALANKGIKGKAAQAKLPVVMKPLMPYVGRTNAGIDVAPMDDKRPPVTRGEEFGEVAPTGKEIVKKIVSKAMSKPTATRKKK